MLKKLNFVKILQVFVLSGLFIVAGCESSLSPEEGLQRAEKYRDKGDYRAAIIELKNVLTNSPEHRDTRLMLGEIYLLQRDGFGAATQLRKASESGQGVIDIRSSMGKALLLQEEFDKVLSEVVIDDKDTPDVRLELLTLRAYANFFKNELEQADQVFLEALAIDVKYSAALVGRALIKLEKKQFAESTELVEQVLAVDGNNMDALIVKGKLAFNDRQYVLAEESFQHAIDAAGKRFTFLQPMQPHIYLIQAYVDQGKMSEADRAVKNLAKVNSKNPMLHYLRALIAYESSDFEAASEHIQVIRSVAPDFDSALVLEGAINYALGRLERGNTALTSYLERHPGSNTARKLLAATRLKLEQPQQAYDLILPLLNEDPNNVELLLLAGDALRNAGKPEASIPMIEKALEQDPDNRELKIQLASARLVNGDTDEAIQLLQSAEPTKDKFGNREMLLLVAWSRKKDFDSALTFVDEYIAAHPDDADVLSNSGVILFSMGNADAGRERFEKALKLKPDHSQVLTTWMRVEYKEKEYARAEEILIRLDKVLPENVRVLFTLANVSSLQGKTASGVSWLEKAVAASDTALEPRLVLAQHYLNQGEVNKAKSLMLDAKRIAPENAEVWNAYSVVQNKLGDQQGAFDSLLKADRLQPDSEVILMNLAQTQLNIKDVGAVETLRRLLRVSPANFRAASILALTEMQDGNVAQAIEIAKKQQTFDENRLNAIALEGDLYMLAKDYSKATAAYREAAKVSKSTVLTAKLHSALSKDGSAEAGTVLLDWLKNNPDDQTIRLLLANYYLLSGATEKGVAEYEALLVKLPDNPDILNNLAWAYFAMKNPKALGTAESANKLAPENAAIKDTFGWILVNENQAKRGVKLLQEAASAYPDNAEVNYHYAVALDKSGDSEKARTLLNNLAAAQDDQKIQQEAKKYLQGLAP